MVARMELMSVMMMVVILDITMAEKMGLKMVAKMVVMMVVMLDVTMAEKMDLKMVV